MPSIINTFKSYRATVVESYTVFWTNIMTPEITPAPTVVVTTQPPTTTTKKVTTTQVPVTTTNQVTTTTTQVTQQTTLPDTTLASVTQVRTNTLISTIYFI